MKKNLILNKIEIIGFLLYFIILLVERILALALSFNIGDGYALASKNVFAYLAYIFTAISVVGGFILLPKVSIQMTKSLFSKEEFDFDANNKQIIIGSIVILIGGMMHTGFTVPGIQFAAYGFLIVSMLIRCITSISEKKASKYEAIISFIYLTFYSMTIPVCYMTNLTGAHQIIFYIVEFITTFVLLASFGCMLYLYFKDGKSSFAFSHFIVMLVLASATIAIKWVDEINMFVLIFVVATTLTYLTNLVVKLIKK